ncbi:hypothetical protein ACET3Z_002764 [Daucus carota]
MINGGEFKPDNITLAGVIGGGGVHLREVLHAQAIRYGLSSNEFVASSLIDAYAKEKRLEDAVKVFHEIDVRDLVSRNIIINACVQNDANGCAWEIFYNMVQENVVYDGFTLTSIMKTCSEARDLELGMLVHCCAIKSGLAFETPISNALITMYSRCEAGMTSAKKIFNGLFAPNIISWTAMIAGFMQNENNKESVGFYRYMLRLDIRENSFTFASILPAYSNLASLEEGRSVHARIVKSGFEFDLSVNNALIDLYSKCGHYLNATAGTCEEMMKRAIFARELGDPIVMHDYLTGGFTANTSLAHYCRDNGPLLHIHRAMHAVIDRQKNHGIHFRVLAKAEISHHQWRMQDLSPEGAGF